jgi:hypothetical protein
VRHLVREEGCCEHHCAVMWFGSGDMKIEVVKVCGGCQDVMGSVWMRLGGK